MLSRLGEISISGLILLLPLFFHRIVRHRSFALNMAIPFFVVLFKKLVVIEESTQANFSGFHVA